MSTTVTTVGPVSTGLATAQLNFGQMWRELLLWNPDLDPEVAKRFIQNCYRRVVDRRMWYGNMVKGVLSVPTAYNAGAISVTSGSATVTGAGTAWTSSMVGMQLRSGYMQPTYTIAAVGGPTSLTLDIPWGDVSQSTLGYMIFQSIVNLGVKTKMVLAIVNQRQGFRLLTPLPQEALNRYDSWRASVGWTWMLASYPASATGINQFELYPTPIYQQTFPFIVYVQPPDLGSVQGDADTPVPWLRSDVIVSGAIADAKLFRKGSPYYDPTVAQMKQVEHAMEVEKMVSQDQGSYMTEMLADYSKWPMSSYGANFMQNHDIGYSG